MKTQLTYKENTLTFKKQNNIIRDFIRNRDVYIMAIPVMLFYIVFKYIPMYGATIAFKDFSPVDGIMGSPWVGFQHFKEFFSSFYFNRLFRNTLLINLYQLLFGFPAPIILALLINEVRNNSFKKMVQTVTYLPHFISIMVVCGILTDFLSREGILTNFIVQMGGTRENMLLNPSFFRTIYVSSDIWQKIGWESIIYLAALISIDQELYEAAKIDGASKFKQALKITIPGIIPTVVIMLILRIGQIMNIGFEKIILLYSPTTYETADVISSYVYRKGLQDFSYSYSSAVGIFNSIINLILLLASNSLSKKLNETSLW